MCTAGFSYDFYYPGKITSKGHYLIKSGKYEFFFEIPGLGN